MVDPGDAIRDRYGQNRIIDVMAGQIARKSITFHLRSDFFLSSHQPHGWVDPNGYIDQERIFDVESAELQRRGIEP
jgi:hypothetical protein